VIVTKDSGGPREFVEDQTTGLVVESDPRSVAIAIDQLHFDRRRALAMGQCGLEKVKAMNLSWQHVVEKLICAAV